MFIVHHIVRFIVAIVVLWSLSTLVPGFSVLGFWTAFFASIVIAGVGWVIESFLGKDISPFARGVVGFIVSAVVVLLTAWLIPGIRISFLGALLASLVIGVIDIFIPTRTRQT
ncbi:phage holin family protein [Thermoflavimicrobium daqui]|uniref:Phage holin family protein n=1 Tax=Thermoflavimicrobium daqui TaxID=2137476 RepID=A0A364K928_9BACL|nr:phage holin family protein [Thermoflavimicrobium daqui]RAL26788.1 hypothetical protein DL897_01670 [Thermoflavimicrobium daqui]